jgi:hypothetical protein
VDLQIVTPESTANANSNADSLRDTALRRSTSYPSSVVEDAVPSDGGGIGHQQEAQ